MGNIPLDAHGQPADLRINYNRRLNRAVHELIGFMRGIVADNHVSEGETERLKAWVLNNAERTTEWPVNILVARLERVYADGTADEEERADLRELISGIVGRQDDDTFLFSPTDLPLTKPAPDVVFDSNEFVFTGKFLFGSRKICQKEVEMRGGRCSDRIRLQTSYLVIGSMTSRDWKFSSFGNKIRQAVEYVDRCPIAMVSEKHWESFLLGGAG